jgi:hypothetical protein
LIAKFLRIDEINSDLAGQTTANTSSPIVASFPTHRSVSDDSWPTVLGIVPFSRLPAKFLRIDEAIRPHSTPSLPYKAVTLLPEHVRPMPEHGAVAAKRTHDVGGQPEEQKCFVFFFSLATQVFLVVCLFAPRAL